jgi:hypothetical protein
MLGRSKLQRIVLRASPGECGFCSSDTKHKLSPVFRRWDCTNGKKPRPWKSGLGSSQGKGDFFNSVTKQSIKTRVVWCDEITGRKVTAKIVLNLSPSENGFYIQKLSMAGELHRDQSYLFRRRDQRNKRHNRQRGVLGLSFGDAVFSVCSRLNAVEACLKANELKTTKLQLKYRSCSLQGGHFPIKLCNGTRLQVKHFRKNIIETIILREYAKWDIIFFP